MPILTVATAATARALALLATVKDELGITDTASNAKLTRWIDDETARITDHCAVAADQLGRRTFASEAMMVTFDASEVDVRCDRSAPLVMPWRIPVTAIASVVEGGVTLDPTGYEAAPMAGLLHRLDANGDHTRWAKARIVVTQTAGWDLSTEAQPEALRSACIELVRLRWLARDRDPNIRSIDVQDVDAVTYFDPDKVAKRDGMPEDVAALLDPFRAVVLA